MNSGVFFFLRKTSPCRKRSPAKGVWQKSEEKSDRSIRKSDRKVTESIPTTKKVIELLLPHSFCGTLKTSTIHISNFCSGLPLRKVHEPTILWFGLPGQHRKSSPKFYRPSKASLLRTPTESPSQKLLLLNSTTRPLLTTLL